MQFQRLFKKKITQVVWEVFTNAKDAGYLACSGGAGLNKITCLTSHYVLSRQACRAVSDLACMIQRGGPFTVAGAVTFIEKC